MTSMLKRDSTGRLLESDYRDMRRRVLASIASEQLTEDSDLYKFLDSLELAEVTVEVEESGESRLWRSKRDEIAFLSLRETCEGPPAL